MHPSPLSRFVQMLCLVAVAGCQAQPPDNVSVAPSQERDRASTAVSETAELPSWNEGPSRRAILEFVARVTAAGSPDFVPPNERISVFDNDGTLWSEQPIYTQLAFALDRIRALAPQHPEWS